mmetsp:Transcript_111798/g.174633  ORF Transcript_111798/g.174633 Transcript_111798/m.174633 type:complete len:89 (+) Transcript_111798:3-269(+)
MGNRSWSLAAEGTRTDAAHAPALPLWGTNTSKESRFANHNYCEGVPEPERMARVPHLEDSVKPSYSDYELRRNKCSFAAQSEYAYKIP